VKVLGAVLAGGESRRFGSDKAEVIVAGRPLIEHVVDALSRDCDAVVVCGRRQPASALEDRPCAGLGPLGGLCAALAYGAAGGFDAVLSVPCDVPDLPTDLLQRLSGSVLPAFVSGLPVVGLWPCALSAELERYLARSEDRSMRGWARAAKASGVNLPRTPSNINTPGDLEAYLHG
jgi:molybdopterin-guanine dinucleotide biosynthesis protein A